MSALVGGHAYVLAERLTMLAKTVIAGLLAILLGSLVVVALASYYGLVSQALTWWLTVIPGFVVLRLLLLRAFRKSPHASRGSTFWAVTLAIGELVDGLVAGSAFWMFASPTQPELTQALSFLLILLLLGLVLSSALYFPSYLCAATPVYLPMIFYYSGTGTSWGYAVVCGLLVSWVYLGSMAVSLSRNVGESIRLRRSNELLLRTIREERDAAVDATKNAERASASKTSFLAAASHDLRQPLHAIALLTKVLERDSRSTPQYPIVRRLFSAVDAFRRSIDAMLDLSRLDAGSVVPHEQTIRLDELVAELFATHSPTAEARGLRLAARASKTYVSIDPRLVVRLMSNLIDNAMKFTDRGGLLVAARARPSGEVWLEVWDTGCGIPESDTGIIFDEFVQLRNPGRDRAKGLGLGLSIVERLSRVMGMQIEVASRVNRGTRMRVRIKPDAVLDIGWLDTAQPSDFGKTAPDVMLPPRVLVVDDEIDARESLCSLLRSYGVTCAIASTYRQAIEVWDRNGPFDAVVSDYWLGEQKTGIDIVKALRARSPHGLVAMLITGESQQSQLREMNGIGVPVMLKPIDTSDFINQLHQAHSQHFG